MRLPKLALAAALVAGLALSAGLTPPVWAERLPVECSGTGSLCYKYSRCTEGATTCTVWTVTYWYYYAGKTY